MATIADVAKLAGVSKTTVSHALSGKRPVAPTTKERITKVIEELGFRPNALARSLRMQRSQMIALIIPDITIPYYSVLARGLQDAIIKYGYCAIICNTDGKQRREIEFTLDAIQRQMDGIVLSSFYNRIEEIQRSIKDNVPLVSIGPGINNSNADQVTTDDQQGAMNITRYLIQKGHRRIGMISGSPEFAFTKARLAGYREALAEANIPFDPTLVAQGDITRAGGAQATRILLDQTSQYKRPTAIFCINDLMAVGAMDTARALDLAIPRELAIVGYGDTEAASFVAPALTTVLNPAYDIGKIAGRLLIERLEGLYKGPGQHVIVPHQLVQRASA